MFLRLLLALCALTLASPAAWANPVRTERTTAWLISEDNALVPGTTQWLAVRLELKQGWHTYWLNPGDTGEALQLGWTMPQGLATGAIAWPFPRSIPVGPLANIGYTGEAVFLVPVTTARDVPLGQDIELEAAARWLVCEEICVPEEARLALTLPVAGESAHNPLWRDQFSTARAHLPRAEPVRAEYRKTGARLSIQIHEESFKRQIIDSAHFFPFDDGVVRYAQPQRLSFHEAGATLELAAAKAFALAPDASLQGVLVVEDKNGSQRAYTLDAAPAAAATGATLPVSIWTAIGLALLGGLLLNFMPCVLPILALKAVDVAGLAGRSPAIARNAALAYAAGILVSVLALAAAMLILRVGGTLVGWGFQLQSPAVVLLLAYVTFTVGLALSGFIDVGSTLQRFGDRAGQRLGGGSFATGLLAVVLASPCTVPFMATALGFALVAPPSTALVIFLALGVGLAAPALALAAFPASGRLLPRPGPWLPRFKSLMAFPLYATAGWLVSILSVEAGRPGVMAALGGAVLIAFAAWLWRDAPDPARPSRARLLSVALCLATALSLPWILAPVGRALGPARATSATADWSPEAVATLRAQGRSVFVNFTADWCLTCKVNESLVLSTASVQRAFTEQGVHVLTADWTGHDPVIGAALAAYGRAGIPVYVLYPPAGQGEARFLPTLLTKQVVFDALASLNSPSPQRDARAP